MGAYLSEPITNKESSTEENEGVRVASSSMQGWRVSQEVINIKENFPMSVATSVVKFSPTPKVHSCPNESPIIFPLQDAHNAILNFDERTSLFAVYDGHGGHEVAEYTAKKLPSFIKNNDDYINGNIEKVA